MNKRALYEEYLVMKATTYFLTYKEGLESRLEADKNSLANAKTWEETCRLQGRIEGLKMALSKLVVPEE